MRKISLAGFSNTARRLKPGFAVGLALLLAVGTYLHPAQAAQGLDAASLRLRIGVVKDGITVITPDDLAGAGVNLATIDPRTFALSSLGKPVAIHVENRDPLGTFEGADRLYFFGEKFRSTDEMDQKYTDERVYWLDIGGTPGPRMAEVDATPANSRTPPADFAANVRAEQSLIWWTLLSLTVDTQDTWFWARLQPKSNTPAPPAVAATVDLLYDVPHPVIAKEATLHLEEVSNAFVYAANPDHHTTAALNGVPQPVIDQTWDSPQVQGRIVFDGTVPPGVLTNGTNKLTVSAWTVPGAYVDDVYVNYWELEYRREFKAWEDQLDFKAEAAGIQEYAVSEFASSNVWVWDVTNSAAPIRLLLQTTGQSFHFQANTSVGKRYWLQGANSFQGPKSVRVRPPTGLRTPQGGADAVVVTSTELRSQAERLADWHRAHGRRALVVDIQDAYDEFNDGIYHPKAVQAMMKWAATHWQSPAPAYLTLFGDGHWNFKNYNPTKYPGGPNPVPPYLAWADPWQGEVPVDGLYGDLNDDGLPEIAVGRIAVGAAAEAATVVDKILAYDETQRTADWQRRAVFVADNADSAGDFPVVSDEIAAFYTPPDLQRTRVYLPPAPTAEQISTTKNALFDAVNTGALMVQYAGHGSIDRWAGEALLTTADITAGKMSNGERLPVVLTFNCLDGYFAYAGNPPRSSIAESMLRQAGGGSIAAISPAGLGTTDLQHAFRQILLTVIFKDGVRDLGRALTIAKQRFTQAYGPSYVTQTIMLFGDPALRLPGSAGLAQSIFLPTIQRR